jgi:hypothetical protein
MPRRARLPALLLLAGLLLWRDAAAGEPQPAARDSAALGALIDRCVQAHGGAEALSKAERLRVQGHVTSLLHPGAQGKISRVYTRPDRLEVTVAWPGEPPEVRLLEGTHGTRNGVEVQGALFTSMLLQLVRIDLPWLLHNARAIAVDKGEVKLGGRTLRAVEVALGGGAFVTADIDPKTGLIARSRTQGQGTPPVEFATTYEEYQEVEGVQISFKEGNWANGRDTGDTVVDLVEVGRSPPAKKKPATF